MRDAHGRPPNAALCSLAKIMFDGDYRNEALVRHLGYPSDCVLGHSHSLSFDHRRRAETLRTAMATAFFCSTNTTGRLPRVGGLTHPDGRSCRC